MACKKCLTEFKEFIDDQVKAKAHLSCNTWFEWMRDEFYEEFGIKETKGFVVQEKGE